MQHYKNTVISFLLPTAKCVIEGNMIFYIIEIKQILPKLCTHCFKARLNFYLLWN